MDKHWLAIIVGALIVGFGAWWLLKADSTTDDNQQPVRTAEEQEIAEQTAVDDTLPTDVYSLDDVAAHATTDDCWVIFQDSVYDVTELLTTIDGAYGQFCGQDATAVFSAGIDNEGNSVEGIDGLTLEERSLLGRYLVGSFVAE